MEIIVGLVALIVFGLIIRDLFFEECSISKGIFYYFKNIFDYLKIRNTKIEVNVSDSIKEEIKEVEKNETYIFVEEWKKAEFTEKEQEKIDDLFQAISENIKAKSSDEIDAQKEVIIDIIKENLFLAKTNTERQTVDAFASIAINKINEIVETIEFKQGLYLLKNGQACSCYDFIKEKTTEIFGYFITTNDVEIIEKEIVDPQNVEYSTELQKAIATPVESETIKEEMAEQRENIRKEVDEKMKNIEVINPQYTEIGKIDMINKQNNPLDNFFNNLPVENDKQIKTRKAIKKKIVEKAKRSTKKESVKRSTATKKVAKKTAKKVTKKASKKTSKR